MKDFLIDSYMRRVRWEAKVYALEAALLQHDIFTKGRKRTAQQEEAPKRGGIISADAFLAL